MSTSGAKCREPQAQARRGVWGVFSTRNFLKNGLSEAAFRAF